MKTFATTSLIALSLIGISACSKGGDHAAVDVANATGDALGNEVTAVDGDAATANDFEPSLPPPEEENVANLTDNAAEAAGNGA